MTIERWTGFRSVDRLRADCAFILRQESEQKRETRHYITALALFLLGLLAKHSLVPLPVALIVVFWWKRGRIEWKREGVRLPPFFAIGIALGLFLESVGDGGGYGAIYCLANQ